MRIRLLKLFSGYLCIVLCLVFVGCTKSNTDRIYVDVNHIINSRTGMPYSLIYNEQTARYQNTTDHIISATVLSNSSMEGDAYSTTICVMGVNKADEFIKDRMDEGKIDAALIFTADNKMLIYGELFGYNRDNQFSEYKKYESVIGQFATDIVLPNIDYPQGSYSRYNEFAFSETIEFEIYIYGEDDNLKNQLKSQLISRVDALDKQININNEDSDIYALNRADANESVEIGADTYKLLAESKRLYHQSDGAFNVAVAPLSRLWEVDIQGINSYRAIGNKSNWTYPQSLPTIDEISMLKPLVDLDELELTEDEGRYFAKKRIQGLELDLGGIAKGYAVDLCAKILKDNGVLSAQLNISGNIYQVGNYFDPTLKEVSSWKVGVTNPALKHDLFKGYVCAFQVNSNVSIVTSGDYERFYSFGYDVLQDKT